MSAVLNRFRLIWPSVVSPDLSPSHSVYVRRPHSSPLMAQGSQSGPCDAICVLIGGGDQNQTQTMYPHAPQAIPTVGALWLGLAGAVVALSQPDLRRPHPSTHPTPLLIKSPWGRRECLATRPID